MSKYQISQDKHLFKSWEQSQPSLPIFLRSWWWDIVTQGVPWSPIMLIGPEERVEAILLQQHKRKYGLSISLPPLLCPYQGPWIIVHEDENRSFIKSTMLRWQIQEKLIQSIPTNTLSVLHTLPDKENHLAFAWQGFKQTSRYTFIIEDISDPDRCFSQFKGTIRTDIRKASSMLSVEISDDIQGFYQVHNASFRRKNSTTPIPFTLIEQIYQQGILRESTTLHIARDNSGKIYAGALTVSDHQKVYVLISGIDTSLGNIGALNLVYWEVIKYYADKVASLDFEGSMLPGVAPVFLGFGAQPYPYHRLVRYPNRWIAAAAVFMDKGH
jgi:hypothetical protein